MEKINVEEINLETIKYLNENNKTLVIEESQNYAGKETKIYLRDNK